MSDSVFGMSEKLGPVSVIGIYVWYIEGPQENILVDSGMTWEAYEERGKTGHTHVQTIQEGIAKYGLRPSDIDIVIQTQLHIDHRTMAKEFTKARFFIQQAELDYLKNPFPPPVDPSMISKELADSINWEVVNGDTQIVDGVRTLFTPGHTAGGQSVAIDTSAGLAIIDSLCTTDSNWNVPPQYKNRFEFFCPGIHVDLLQTYHSMSRIKEIADIIVPIHEVRFAFIDAIPEVN
ncbi:N-acyl homoserine lactonase family protein [Chloroflexota bacterium]